MNRTIEILIAEDSPTQAAQLQNLLEECGYIVHLAADGLQALEMAHARKPDLVISDIVMPRMDGYQLCKEIKADGQLRDIPVVLVTSLSNPQDVIKGLGCGADSFLRKPYEGKYLISRIEYLRANQVLRQQEQGQMGVEMYLGGQRHFITAERQQILDLLISTYTEAIRLNDGLNRSNQWLHGLYRIAEGLNQAEDERGVCEIAVAGAVELPGIQASWITLTDQAGGNRLVAIEGVSSAQATQWETLENHASIPLWAGDQVYGMISLLGAEEVKFNEEDLSILKGVGNQVGIALERSHLRSHLEQMVEDRTVALRAEVIERKAAEEEATRRLKQLRALHAIDKAIIAVQGLPTSLDIIVKQIAAQLQVDALRVLLLDAPSATLTYAAGTGFYEDILSQHRQPMDEGYIGRVAVGRQLIFLQNWKDADDFARASWFTKEGFVSYIGVPLVVQDELKGVLELFHRTPLAPTEEWSGFLQALALQTAIAIDHDALFSQTRHLLQRTQEEARKVKQIMDTVPEGVIFLDQDFHIQLTNEAGALYLSLLADAKVGDPLTTLDEHPLTKFVNMAHNVSWQEISLKDGQRIFEVATRPMHMDEHVEGWVLVLREVTVERNTQHRLQIQERLAAVGQLAAGIAHDFNNILTPLRIYTDLSLELAAGSGQLHSHLHQIGVAADRARDLVAQILTFSRDSRSERTPQRIQPVIKEVLHLARSGIPTTIELRTAIDESVGPVVADSTQIYEVVMNLCTNAFHALRTTGGLLEVELETVVLDGRRAADSLLKEGTYVRLSVRDNGHGIDPAILPRIFDPFFTTKKPGEGTGMGLSVIYSIVHEHGGEVLVESQLGQGTTFEVYLPLAATEDSKDKKNELDPPVVEGSERILIVDDEAILAFALQKSLEKLGYQVATASNGLEALEHIRRDPSHFDLVITDLTMPQMTGLALALALLTLRPELPVVLMTGYGDAIAPSKYQAAGIRERLFKPFSTSSIGRIVRKVLEQAQP